jgi:hypothetical protein
MEQMCARTTYSGDLRFAHIVNLSPQTLHAVSIWLTSLQIRPSHQHPAISRSANASPVKYRLGSQGDISNSSPTLSPRKPGPTQRKGSIWDSFFQYDITYQGGGTAKAKK